MPIHIRLKHRLAAQRRHRLNRGGDRQANSALWRIVFTLMATDPRTQAYVTRRTTEGKTTRDHALPQTLRRPRDLQDPDRTAPLTGQHQPTPEIHDHLTEELRARLIPGEPVVR